ncbi:MAG: DUF3318 domain-containing protein [Elainellaceae cyanobacterium]
MTNTANPQPSAKPPKTKPPARDAELGRLMELLPASGRMWCKLVSQPKQREAIAASLPKPWKEICTISINLDLWHRLPQNQRDLLLLRTSCRGTAVRWVKPGLYQGLLGVGLTALVVEAARGDAAGIVVFGGLSALAVRQIWRSIYSVQTEMTADADAVRVATRRGYERADAARSLMAGIKALPAVEGRTNTMDELLRYQALKPIAQPDIGAP